MLCLSWTICRSANTTSCGRLRQVDTPFAFFQLERSPAPEPGFFPGDESVRVGFQVPEALLVESFPRIGERPVIQPRVLGQSHATVRNHTCPGGAGRRMFPA
jgi:hypothetical protein